MKAKFIGEKIKSVRGDLTRKEFVEKLGTSIKPHTLYRYESGILDPSDEFINELCEKFNLPISYFVDDQIQPVKILPNDLQDLDMDMLYIVHDMQKDGLSADDIRELGEFAKRLKSK